MASQYGKAYVKVAIDAPAGGVATTSEKSSPALDQALLSARGTIRRLEDELKEARQELADSVEERSILAARLKQVSLAKAAHPKPERQRKAAPAAGNPLSSTDIGSPQNPNEYDALGFLRQIEEERAQQTDCNN